jgi:hypothetical protein
MGINIIILEPRQKVFILATNSSAEVERPTEQWHSKTVLTFQSGEVNSGYDQRTNSDEGSKYCILATNRKEEHNFLFKQK